MKNKPEIDDSKPLFAAPSDEEIVSKSAAVLINLLAAHWIAIKRLADEEGSDDCSKVSATIVFSFGGKAPAASVEISYVPLKTKDSATVHCDDPDQEKMEFQEAL